jgi:PAS domain S-box-containing protein
MSNIKPIDPASLFFAQGDFESFFLHHPSPSFLVDGESWRIVAANLAAEALYGWTAAEFATMPLHALGTPDERIKFEANLDSVRRGASCNRFSTRHVKKNGDTIDVEVLTQPMRLGGRALCQAIIIDVTARARAELLLQGLTGQSITGIYVVQDGRFVYLNPRLAEMFGYTVDEVMRDEQPLLILPPEVREEMARHSESRNGEEERDIHYSLRSERRDGTLIELEIYASRLMLDGRVALAGTVLDTTQHMAADAALRESESRFRGAFDQAFTGMAISAPDGRWLQVNRALCDMLGYTNEEMCSRTFQSVTHADDIESNVALKDSLFRGEVQGYRTEKRFIHKDGSTVWAALHVSAVRNAQGTAIHMLAEMHDFTARKRAEMALKESEAQLHHAQKMEAVGRLAGGVAHDFNNLLSVIGCNAEIGEDLTRDGFAAAEEFVEIRTAVDRAATLTRQLLSFSRRQVLARAPISINDVVIGVERMLRRVIGEDVGLQTTLDEHAGVVVADRGQLEQVLMNLAVNARDAMPSGGRIVIATQRLGTGHVAISVTDNGSGMDEETRARAFDPFFTTKESGKGTGLGLSTVYGIVQQSGGEVIIASELSRGTTVTVTLPVHVSDDENVLPFVPSQIISPSAAEATGDTILLVEDEPGVRAVTRKILVRLGYRVIEAPNGADALSLWSTHRADVRLVLTDLVMPLMGGRELAERLHKAGTDVPVLFMSGYADEERYGALPMEAELIGKPISADVLRDRIGALLRERRGG